MTKEELVAEVAKKAGVKEEEASQIVKLFIEEVKTRLDKGEKVDIPGFGNFLLGEDK